MTNSPLGIVAGGGDLPRAVAQSARESGREVFVLALAGLAGDWVREFSHETVSLGEVGKALRALKDHSCHEMLLVGRVDRPRFADIKLDAKGVLVAPRVIAAARKGDDALLRSLVDIFENAGHRVISVTEAAPGLVLRAGILGRIHPTAEQEADIAQAFAIVRAMGALDIGQAAVVCDGLVLAVEAAEGTDAMIKRVATLREAVRGQKGKPRGVLVKAPKPVQDRKTDLPVIGVETLRNAAASYLAGIAVEADGALILDRARVIEAADAEGLFIAGVAR
ncbi:MAG TPA: UDP-2,3-diacylglucosamine diphosphatase LpxI [Rhizomicrobium sp.]